MKKELQENTQADMELARGAMRELLAHNRKINRDLVSLMEGQDFGLLEEYTMLSEGILKAAKLLTEMNSQTPKTIKDIKALTEEKKAIDLDELIND